MNYQINYYDKFIKYKKFSPYIKSIKFLYPNNMLLQYKRNLKHINFKVLFYFIKAIKRLLSFFYEMVIYCFQFKEYNLKNKKDILVVSHHLKSNKLSKNDFYFGDLISNLQKRKIKCHKLLINQSEIQSNFLNKTKNTLNVDVINKYCNFITEFKILFIQVKEVFLVLFFYKNLNISKNFLHSLIFSIFEYETVFALRTYFFMREYIHRYSPKILIFTYEGYPWERMCIKAAKDSSKKIVCIGYQHSIIYDEANPLNRSLGADFDPDIIWASGNHSFKVLNKSKNLRKVKIYKTGNFTKSSQLKINFKIKRSSKQKTCLVLPVGIYSECVELFNFSYECAFKNNNIKYIWRLHPVIKKEILNKMTKIDFDNLPKNIYFSEETLDNDAKNSDCVLYRSSTGAIQVLQYGCIPIYLDLGKKINFDAIQNFKPKKIINTYKNFYKVVDSIDEKEKKKEKNNAIFYKKNIYGKIDYKKILNSLQNLI